MRDRVVLLPALAAEREREQDACRGRPGTNCCPLRREVAVGLGLERRVDRVAAADELVQAEGEDREPGRPGC